MAADKNLFQCSSTLCLKKSSHL